MHTQNVGKNPCAMNPFRMPADNTVEMCNMAVCKGKSNFRARPSRWPQIAERLRVLSTAMNLAVRWRKFWKTMSNVRKLGSVLLTGLPIFCVVPVSAQAPASGPGQPTVQGAGQAYPNKPIRLVTSPAGGAGDFLARLIAAGISTPLGEQVLVDNRPSGIIPGELVARASPDGYTLLVTGNSLWIGPLLQDTPYDPVKDFLPITAAVTSPNVLIVHPSLSVRSVKELLALARARPGELNYGSSGTGSTNHLAAEMFKAMARVKIERVNYKGSGFALTALLAGEIQIIFNTAGVVTPHLKSGRLKALAVTSAAPSSLTPGVPTLAASGLAGYEAVTVNGLLAPPKTPSTIINRLNQETVRYLSQPDVRQKVLSAGVEVVAGSPEAFAAIIKSEMASMGRVIKDAGIRTN